MLRKHVVCKKKTPARRKLSDNWTNQINLLINTEQFNTIFAFKTHFIDAHDNITILGNVESVVVVQNSKL